MNIDSFFKAPGAASAGRLKRQQALGSLSAAKRSREDELTIRETTDEEFRASWGVGSSTAKRTGPDGRVGGRDAGGSAADDVGEPRLHGSGASAERQRIMDIVDAGEDMPEGVDLQSLKRMLLRFEKVLTKNQDLRSKYADQPLKYLDSETDLAEEIKALTTLSSVPELYPTLIDLSSHASILALLSHENTDITIAAIALLDELTDEDLVAETTGDAAEGVAALVAALVEKDALPLLVSNLGRLNEDKPDEKQGIFNTLSVIENFLSIDPTLAERIVDSTSIIPWILGRIAVKGFDSVRQYASELLAILLQTSRANRARVHDLDGVDTLLRVLASYRRKDPKDADETEFMENVFDALCLCLAEPPAKTKFVDAEGLELMLMMIKEKKMSRMRAIKVIDHALLGEQTAAAAQHFVEILGLKTLFAALMKKGTKKYKKEYPDYSPREEDEHLVSIIASLLGALAQREHRDRLLFKFIESEFEKSARLLELHGEYAERVRHADTLIAARKRRARQDPDYEDDIAQDEVAEYMERLDAGLFTLQLATLIIAYCCDESYEIRDWTMARLAEKGIATSTLEAILNEYADNLGDKDADEDADDATRAAADAQRSQVRRLARSLVEEHDRPESQKRAIGSSFEETQGEAQTQNGQDE